MQLKILHRFYPCQSLVSKWDKETSDICKLCKSESANLLHTFWECKIMKTFWNSISEWLTPVIFQYTANLTCLNILFGLLPYTIGNHCSNHCLLYCKYYVHIEILNNKMPMLQKFQKYYKDILELERTIYVIRNEIDLYDKLFSKLVAICQ